MSGGIVLDASVMVAELMPDEDSELFNRANASEAPILVPEHWFAEVLNSLIVHHRYKRLTATEFHALRQQLEIYFQHIVVSPCTDTNHISRIAHDHKLTAYDAIYLALAQQQRAHLATLDDAMIKAARKLKIKLLAAR